MISAAVILMQCNGIRISLKSEKYNQRNRVCHGVHDTPFSFLHFFLFFVIFFSSSDFTDESEGIPAEAITHGFSRIFGLWPMAGARNVLLLFFVTQISQMTQIFLCGRVLSHRFHRYTQIFYGISVESLFPTSGGICTDRTGRLRENPCVIASSGKPPNKFRVIR